MNILPNRINNLKGNRIANLVGKGALARQYLTFQEWAKPSGVGNLSRYITINGTQKDADYIYIGNVNSATWVPHVNGANLALQVGTAPTYLRGSQYLGGSLNNSILFNGGGYFKENGTTVGNVGTNDIFKHVIFKVTGTTCVIAAKRNAGVGWELGIDASDRLYFTIEDSGGAVTTVSAALTYGEWLSGYIVVDRSGSCQIYIDETASGSPVVISGAALTLDSATSLCIGADSGGNNPCDSNVAYLASWSEAAWLDSHLQPTIIAKIQSKLMGAFPQMFKEGTGVPTTSTRAFSAYLDKLEDDRTTRKLYLIADNQMRQCSRLSKSGKYFEGVLLEPQVTNLALNSEDLSLWTLLDAGDTIDANAVAAPNKETTMDGLVADSTDGIHGVTQNATLTATSTSISFYAVKGDKTWFAIEDTTIADCIAYFDVDNVAKGATPGAGVNSTLIEDMGDGIVRCTLIVTGTAAAHTINYKIADADNDDTFAGDGATTNGYMWGFQIESNGLGKATSYIPTAGAAATRLKDDLVFPAGANIGGEDITGLTIAADILFDGESNLGSRRLLEISDGKSASDRLGFYYASGGSTISGYSAASGGNSGGCSANSDITDGEIKKIKFSFKTNFQTIYSNNDTDPTPDVLCDMPDDKDTIQLGNWTSGTQQPSCLIRNLRIFSNPDIDDVEV